MVTVRSIAIGLTLLAGSIFFFAGDKRLDMNYLLHVARHRPPFGIAGTDPKLLWQHSKSLGQTQTALMYAQPDITSALAIRSLYPVHFLGGLAQLEAARQKLIAEPSEPHARAYMRELVRTSYFGLSDAAAHHEALLTVMPPSEVAKAPLYSLEGASSAEHIAALSSLMTSRMTEVHDIVQRDITCAFAHTCELPPRPVLETPQTATAVRTATMNSVERFYDHEVPEGYKERFVLDSSACLATLDAPYYVVMRTTPQAGERLHALNDLFLFPTAKSKGKVLTYLNERGVQYVAQRALNFYICPSVQYEHGLVYALKEARKNLPEAPLQEPDGTISEKRLRVYLNQPQADPSQDDARIHDELTLMLYQKSAGLDRLVARISTVLSTHLSQHKNNIPFDMSAPDLFITHNALPSLFLLHNPHAGTPLIPRTISQEEREAVATFYATEFRSLDSLLRDLTWDELVEDIRAVRSIDTE